MIDRHHTESAKRPRHHPVFLSQAGRNVRTRPSVRRRRSGTGVRERQRRFLGGTPQRMGLPYGSCPAREQYLRALCHQRHRIQGSLQPFRREHRRNPGSRWKQQQFAILVAFGRHRVERPSERDHRTRRRELHPWRDGDASAVEPLRRNRSPSRIAVLRALWRNSGQLFKRVGRPCRGYQPVSKRGRRRRMLGHTGI